MPLRVDAIAPAARRLTSCFRTLSSQRSRVQPSFTQHLLSDRKIGPNWRPISSAGEAEAVAIHSQPANRFALSRRLQYTALYCLDMKATEWVLSGGIRLIAATLIPGGRWMDGWMDGIEHNNTPTDLLALELVRATAQLPFALFVRYV